MTERERVRDLHALGEALGSTQDLDRLLRVVLDSAVRGLRAPGGLVMLTTPAGDLGLVAEQGLRRRGVAVPAALRRGQGVLGDVLVDPRARRGRLGDPGLVPAAEEPAAGHLLAVPLQRDDTVVAVLALLDPGVTGAGFTDDDEEALVTFAGQAGVAVGTLLTLREAQRMAITDEVTGLWNFRYLSLSLTREVERATRFGRPLAVLMLDLDRFKEVNDVHGHARGDAVLHELAARLSAEVRDVDVLARYGGEEFVLVLPETDADGAVGLARRIVESVRSAPFTAGGGPPLRITVSVGAAVFPRHGRTASELMRSADQAMYAVKAAGRDGWAVATRTAPSAEPGESSGPWAGPPAG